jgi:hypothetical protein
MKPAKYLGPECNELPNKEKENIKRRLDGSKKLGSHSELELNSSSRPTTFVSRQLTVGSPSSENDKLYVRF